jgi:ferredoxin
MSTPLTIELVCKQHPQPELGQSDSMAAVHLHGCLAGLGGGAYLALAVLGFDRIILRTDACESCPLGKLKSNIKNQVNKAQRLLAVVSNTMNLTLTEPSQDEAFIPRPLWEVDNPPLSRRDLFRMAARQGQITLAKAMTVEQNAAASDPGRDHQRTVMALGLLARGQVNDHPAFDGLGFTSLKVSTACSSCGACARACPTEALTFDKDLGKAEFWLELDGRLCIGCKLCASVCIPQAIEIGINPSFEEIFGYEDPVRLIQGPLTRCLNCSTHFAGPPGQDLCPACEFRKQSPFGSRLHPGLVLRSTEVNRQHDRRN